MGLGEARNKLKDFLKGEGYDPSRSGMKNLASTARLNLILNQNAAMAKSAGDWARMHDPDAMKVFPYVRYHARNDGRTRSKHGDLDGKIFAKDDPFLRTHTPPWEFNCRCWLEEITAKEAGRETEKIQKPTPEDKVKVESSSGFAFDPTHAFEEFDLSSVKSRAGIIGEAASQVQSGKLGNCGIICAPQTSGLKHNPVHGAAEVKDAFSGMKNVAENELKKYGLDPANLPDYETVNQTMGKNAKNIPKEVREAFPAEPIAVGRLCYRAQEAAGLPDVPVTLGRGTDYNGITHLWRDHKDIFVDPEKAVKYLDATLGDPNCRVVVSLKRVVISESIMHKNETRKKTMCLKRIVLHNSERGIYCVLVYDGKELKLVSWHDAPASYGDTEWALK